jgi:hypothetical protein
MEWAVSPQRSNTMGKKKAPTKQDTGDKKKKKKKK